ncbi:MAG: hypothetical protein C0518_00925 [Opitutus sp.]|nr:hypothetical protein [Opitutus sp.]
MSSSVSNLALRLKQDLPATVARVCLALGAKPQSLLRGKRFAEACLIGSFAALKRSPVAVPAEPPLRVVFFTMLGSHSFMTGTELALARAMRNRGHEVHVVLCDGILPACENRNTGNADNWDLVCRKCALRGRGMAGAAGITTHFFSDLVAAASDAEADRLIEAEDFSYIVESSLYKFFRVGRLAGTAEEKEQGRRIEDACRLTARAAIALSRLAPDRVLMSHGVYSSWAPALQIFNHLGISTAVYNKGKRRNSGVINWVKGAMDWDVSREWERVKDRELSTAELAAIQDYLASRVTHKGDALKYNFGEKEEREQTLKRFDLDAAKPIFVLFTNVLWDAASAQKEIAFPNAVEWVMETIRWFAAHPDKQLVVKIHPAEVVIGTNQPFVREIERIFPQLPENVRVIAPQEKVNSWSITQITTAGLVHTSTPGMELPLEGVPCIVVSGVHYRGKGFTLDIGSREEYFRMLDRWEDVVVDRERCKRSALRYAHLLFERYHLDWSFLIERGYGRYVAINARSDAELAAHPTVKLVCDSLERQNDFLRAN